jgi:hypothetical protein
LRRGRRYLKDQEVAGVRYVISYDLTQPDENYGPLYDALSSVGAKRILPFQWVVRWNNTSAANIRAFLQRYLDVNDRIMVSSLDSADWADYNLLLGPNAV